jgi:hypothetical protein
LVFKIWFFLCDTIIFFPSHCYSHQIRVAFQKFQVPPQRS